MLNHVHRLETADKPFREKLSVLHELDMFALEGFVKYLLNSPGKVLSSTDEQMGRTQRQKDDLNELMRRRQRVRHLSRTEAMYWFQLKSEAEEKAKERLL